MRKCRLKSCRDELPKLKDCETAWESKGFCSLDHATEYAIGKAREQQERQRRKQHQADKERIKTRSEHMRECQQAFNQYIRTRDKGLPCISCGATMQDDDLITGSRVDAGHYRSTGSSPALRFNEDNCHAQCVKCNRHLSGSVVDYRLGLIKKIGLKRVEILEGPHEAKKYTVDELKQLKAHYRAKTRELKKQQAA